MKFELELNHRASQLNGKGVVKGLLLSEGNNLGVREGRRNSYAEKAASIPVLLDQF